MKASRWFVLLAAWLLASAAHATPLRISDGPFVWMRATLGEQSEELVLKGEIYRTAPPTVRALRGHVHLYLDSEDGRELVSFAVPYRPRVLGRNGQASSFSLRVPPQDQPVASGRLEHHLEVGD